jgi:hypothetical protein
MPQVTSQALIEIANRYRDLPDAELEAMLDSAWAREGVLGADVKARSARWSTAG